MTESLCDARDSASCPNGPDEYGDYPCDPDPHGDGTATCAVCGWRGRWLPVCDHRVTGRIGWQAAGSADTRGGKERQP